MMNKSCEADPYTRARQLHSEGMIAWKDENIVRATHLFLTGASAAEMAVSEPHISLPKKAHMIELAAIMHLIGGNTHEFARIVKDASKGMERFPERKDRLMKLMDRVQSDPEGCERIILSCKPKLLLAA